MSASPQHHNFTFAEYLTLERDSDIKHEFDAGEIFAMSGGTLRHNALGARIIRAFGNTAPPSCEVLTSDMRVRVVATGRTTYPDVSMVCGPAEFDPEDRAHTTITNPVLLVEVLSVSTEKGDRGNKWLHYQRIPSLREYLLVSQQQPQIEIFRRTPSNSWEHTVVNEGTVTLATGPTLDLSVLYTNLPE